MSLVADRCARAREAISIDALFDTLGWELPQRGRIRCIWPDHEDRTPAMQVYRDTNSVHCFACNKGGDVVEIALRCANPDGGDWSLDEALDWLEAAFSLPPLTPAQTLQGRLRKKLSKMRQPEPGPTAGSPRRQAQVRKQYDDVVAKAFAEVEAKATAEQRVIAGPIKDYIWQEAEQPEVDLTVWAAWARSFIYGSYARLLYLVEFPTPPPGSVIDDRPEMCIRARLWELHRGNEYSSSWHLQLL